MSIIVVGKLIIKSKYRDEFVKESISSIELARQNKHCEDFSVSPDPIEVNRVNIYEKWSNREALESFRSSGPDNDFFSLVESFHINEYEI